MLGRQRLRSSRRRPAPRREAPRRAGGCARIAVPRRPRRPGPAPVRGPRPRRPQPRLVEQAAQRDAGPLRVPDRLQQPRLAERRGSSRARPLPAHSRVTGELRRRQRAQLRERQRKLALASLAGHLGLGQPLLDLRQQSHHDRRQHAHHLYGGRRGPFPGLRLERSARRRRQ